MKSTLVVMATGLGKTVVMAEIARLFPFLRGRILLLAHRDELIKQAQKKFSIFFGEEDLGIEMADSRCDERLPWSEKPRVVLASVQTLNAGRYARYEKFNPMEFGLILTDEAHHSAADSYRRIYEWFGNNPDMLHVGVTATPDRTDEKALGQVFDSVAFQYGILDGINNGWLVPIEQQFVHVHNLDLSNCGADKFDLKSKDLAKIMEEEGTLYEVADSTRRIAAGRKTLVFAASVEHAFRIAEILNKYDEGCAIAIDGKTDRESRGSQVKRFARGEFPFLVNCGVFTEGFDDNSIQVVSIARPTKSRSLYAQMIGRGTRVLDGLVDGLPISSDRRIAIAGSAKPSCLVLDFVGNSGRHKLISTVDILGGGELDEVVERAVANTKNARGPLSMQEELDKAKREIEQERATREATLTPEAKFWMKAIDPFDAFDICPPREPAWHKGRRPTPPMAATLIRAGVDPKWIEKASFVEAGHALKEIRRRREAGLSTLKQLKLLKKHGVDATNMPFEKASAEIDAIIRNGWKRPKPQENDQ